MQKMRGCIGHFERKIRKDERRCEKERAKAN